MNILKVVITIISFFLLFFFESLLLKVFGFSLFILFSLIAWTKVKDVWFFVYITLFGVLIDIMFSTHLGVHISSVLLSITLFELLFLIIPRDSGYRYLNFFLSISIYYIFTITLNSLLYDRIFSKILLNEFVVIFVRSIFSVGIAVLIERLLLFLRDSKGERSIRLR